jgi:hypothetical protein
MITTPLLEEKERTQKQLAKEAQYDVWKYMENTHNIVLEAQKKYGFKLKYADRDGGILESLCKRPSNSKVF